MYGCWRRLDGSLVKDLASAPLSGKFWAITFCFFTFKAFLGSA